MRGIASVLGASLALAAFVSLHADESARPRARANANATAIVVPADGRIDFHTHLEPTAPERVRAMLDIGHVDVAVNLASVPAGEPLAAVLELERALPGRVVTFAGIDWRLLTEPDFGEQAADALERAVAQGARGLKIPKALGLAVPTPETVAAMRAGRAQPRALLAIDDERLAPIFERAGRLGVPVAIHVADPVAFWEPLNKENERWQELSLHPEWSYAGVPVPSHRELIAASERLYARHPRTTFVGVHVAGWPEDLDEVERMLREHPNLWVDIAARVPELGHHPAARGRAFFERFSDRILFGTDVGVGPRGVMLGAPLAWPETQQDVAHFWSSTYRYLQTPDVGFAHPTPIQGEWTIDGVNLPPELLRKLYRDNAVRLLRLENPATTGL